MSLRGSTLLRRQFRVVFYVLVVLVLFLVRGPRHWSDLLGWRDEEPAGANVFVVAGADVAPTLLEVLVRAYRNDYPQVTVDVVDRGTAHALQALARGEADVALLAREPREEEREAFVELVGAEPVCEPIALAGLALVASSEASVDSLTWSQLESLVRGEPRKVGFERLYLEDPNLGTWDAVIAHFAGVSDVPPTGALAIAFLADRAELFEALRTDPRAVGIVSSIFLPDDRAPAGLGLVALRGENDARAVLPTHLAIGHGEYPLRHRLHVACRADARGEPAKFVTFASSARGQRLVERAGFLPARQVLREILLDERPLGAR